MSVRTAVWNSQKCTEKIQEVLKSPLTSQVKCHNKRGLLRRVMKGKQPGVCDPKSSTGTQHGPVFNGMLALENLQYAWLRQIMFFCNQPCTVGLLQCCQRGL